jgi:hypothetical protein
VTQPLQPLRAKSAEISRIGGAGHRPLTKTFTKLERILLGGGLRPQMEEVGLWFLTEWG